MPRSSGSAAWEDGISSGAESAASRAAPSSGAVAADGISPDISPAGVFSPGVMASGPSGSICARAAASSAENQITQNWNVVVPGNQLLALRTVRSGLADRLSIREAKDTNIQKTTNDSAENKYNYVKNKIHFIYQGSLLIYRQN